MKKHLPVIIFIIGLIMSNPTIDSLQAKIENITIVHEDGKRIFISDSNKKKDNDILMDYNKMNNFIVFKLVFADIAESYNPLKGLNPKMKEHLYFGILTKWIKIY